MQGVPASETNDISLPSFKSFIISDTLSLSLNYDKKAFLP